MVCLTINLKTVEIEFISSQYTDKHNSNQNDTRLKFLDKLGGTEF